MSGYNSPRALPHSLEAEEHLLSCCLMGGADVIERCKESRITPSSFYDSKHGVIFDSLLGLVRRRTPIDISILAEELKASCQLDHIGGFPFLVQVSNRIPTTAQAGYFIEKVREHATRREIIGSASLAIEECYALEGDLVGLSSRIRQNIEAATDGATGALSLLSERRFNPAAPIIDAPATYKLGEVAITTAGNLSNFTGQTGVGKSAMVDALLAAPMAVAGADCLGLRGFNEKGRPLLHFDTEQSSSDYQRQVLRSLRRAGLSALPSWLHSYHLTGLNAGQCRETILLAMSQHARRSKGLFAVIIDGWGDLVVNPNDEDECFPFVAEMHGLAIKYDCSITGVLHLNPGSESKSRGHLGSQLERKAETVMQLEMTDGITSVWATKKRGAPIPKSKAARFRWGAEAGMHVTATGDQEPADVATLRELSDEVFGSTRLRYADACVGIEKARRVKTKAAEKWFTRMQKHNVICRVGSGYWEVRQAE